jgi:hypothetical protein
MSSEMSQFLNASVDFGGGTAHGVSVVAKVARVDAKTIGDVGNVTAARGAGANVGRAAKSDVVADNEVESTAKPDAREFVSASAVDIEIASARGATAAGTGDAAVADIGVVASVVDAAVVDTGDAVVAAIEDSAAVAVVIVVIVVVVVAATANVDADGIAAAATIAATGDIADAAIVDAAMTAVSARSAAVVAAVVAVVQEGAAAKAAGVVIVVALSAAVAAAANKNSAVGAAAVVEASSKDSLIDEVAQIFARFTGVGLFALVCARFVKRTVPGAFGEAGGAPQLSECKAPDDAFAADASTLLFAPTSPS